MKNNEHELKLKCAQLNEIKKDLINQLKSINEQLVAQSMANTQANTPAQAQATKKVKVSPKQAIEAPIKTQQGFAYTGNAAEAQEDLLKSYSDNPNTEETEEAKDASWQSVNSAVSNYMTQQVAKLAQAQQMTQ
jgi:hypothetical protein